MKFLISAFIITLSLSAYSMTVDEARICAKNDIENMKNAKTVSEVLLLSYISPSNLLLNLEEGGQVYPSILESSTSCQQLIGKLKNIYDNDVERGGASLNDVFKDALFFKDLQLKRMTADQEEAEILKYYIASFIKLWNEKQ